MSKASLEQGLWQSRERPAQHAHTLKDAALGALHLPRCSALCPPDHLPGQRFRLRVEFLILNIALNTKLLDLHWLLLPFSPDKAHPLAELRERGVPWSGKRLQERKVLGAQMGQYLERNLSSKEPVLPPSRALKRPALPSESPWSYPPVSPHNASSPNQ